jgi:hypothetical protein
VDVSGSLYSKSKKEKGKEKEKALLGLGLWLGGLCWQNSYKVTYWQGSSDAVPNPETITTG